MNRRTVAMGGDSAEGQTQQNAQHDAAHPEDFCELCGGKNPVWSVDSDRWNMALDRAVIACPSCFIAAHEAATGMTCMWKIEPATPFRWIEAEGRPTPFQGVSA